MELRNSNYPKFWYNKKVRYKFILKIFQVIYKLYILFLEKLSIKQCVDVPVICVGNITVGGSGKTPFVKLLYLLAKSMGYTPHILIGSYQHSSRSILIDDDTKNLSLDEGLIHSDYATTWQGKNRYLSAKLALQGIGGDKPDMIILDDGLQNYKLHYDVRVVMIGAKHNFANFQTLPLGPLRTNFSKILDYDFITFLKEKWDISKTCSNNLKLNLNKLNSAVMVYNYQLINFSQFNCQYKKSYIVFSGLADNSNFFSSCLKLGQKKQFKIIKTYSYKDHYKYKYEDIEQLIFIAKKNKCSLLTSYKDLVKIKLIVKDSKLEGLATRIIECLSIEAKIVQNGTSKDSDFLKRIIKLANNKYNKRKKVA